jgi:chromate reductase
MTRILGISGSLRKASLNTAVLRAAEGVLEDGSLKVVTLHGIPLYDGDLEDADGIPDAVTRLKEEIIASDGLIIATPEYNNAMPGVLKNAIDWLSRPPSDSGRVFAGRPVAIVGATPGGMGTVLAQDSLLPVLRALSMRPWFGGRVMLSRASKLMDDTGELGDDAARDQLRMFINGFAAFVRGGQTS